MTTLVCSTIRRSGLAALVGLTIAHACAIAAPPAKPPARKPHPPLILPTADGAAAWSLASEHGHPILLVHFASWSEAGRSSLEKWKVLSEKLVQDGRLTVVGVAHDLHADRPRLLCQWKRINWPIVEDVLNLSEIETLPCVVAVDAKGLIAATDETVDGFLTSLAKAPPPKAATPSAPPAELPDPRKTRRAAGEERAARGWRLHADALMLAGAPAQISEAIQCYERVLTQDPRDAAAMFRLGVARRIRFTGAERQADDFEEWIHRWDSAGRLRPKNGYLHAELRRIGGGEGADGDTYAWIADAVRDIARRGAKPIAVAPDSLECDAATATASAKSPATEQAADDAESVVVIAHHVLPPPSDADAEPSRILVAIYPHDPTGVEWAAGPAVLRVEKPSVGDMTLKDQSVVFPPSPRQGPRIACIEAGMPKKKSDAMIKATVVYTVRVPPDATIKTLKQTVSIPLSAKPAKG